MLPQEQYETEREFPKCGGLPRDERGTITPAPALEDSWWLLLPLFGCDVFSVFDAQAIPSIFDMGGWLENCGPE